VRLNAWKRKCRKPFQIVSRIIEALGVKRSSGTPIVAFPGLSLKQSHLTLLHLRLLMAALLPDILTALGCGGLSVAECLFSFLPIHVSELISGRWELPANPPFMQRFGEYRWKAGAVLSPAQMLSHVPSGKIASAWIQQQRSAVVGCFFPVYI